ncbi:hypothetical protein EON83_04390 [bacterium]|nr:MAG: hypothetical protein EON83_04390 [bacterium]
MKTNITLLRFATATSFLALTFVANAATPSTKPAPKVVAPKMTTAKIVAKTPAKTTTRTSTTGKASLATTTHAKHSSRMVHHTSAKPKPVQAIAKPVKG